LRKFVCLASLVKKYTLAGLIECDDLRQSVTQTALCSFQPAFQHSVEQYLATLQRVHVNSAAEISSHTAFSLSHPARLCSQARHVSARFGRICFHNLSSFSVTQIVQTFDLDCSPPKNICTIPSAIMLWDSSRTAVSRMTVWLVKGLP